MKVYLATSILLLLAGRMLAQPIITNSNHSYSIGETFIVNKTAFQDPGMAGANQTWDFSFVSSIETKTLTTRPTPGTPSFSNSVNITLRDSVNNRNYYYSFFNDSSIAHISDEFASSCVQYHINMYYPLNFNDSLSSSINCQLSPTSGGMQNYNYKYDGYGTLILPMGTFNNVARIKYVSGMPVYEGFGSTAFKGNIYDTTYVWYLPNFHYPIARSKYNYFNRYNNTAVIVQEFNYLSNINVGVNEYVNQSMFNLFPNPTSGILTISSQDISPDLNYEVTDIIGKTVYTGSFKDTKSSLANIDLGFLDDGAYFIRFSQENTIVMKKFVVIR
ncbi:MAG: T9SS type A sorting domain-containing protein [Burkholderiales bacterium]|nr:T9SS type A sorting domain-containing protein [Bacteroidia bacterium]